MLEIRLSGGEDSWPKRRPYMTHRRFSLENARKNHKKSGNRQPSFFYPPRIPRFLMPSRSPNAHFLGIELATDQLRASVVDEQLDLVGVECVDFDTELPEFQ